MNKMILRRTALFRNFNDEELDTALLFLNSRIQSYRKGQTILYNGMVVVEMGVVLKGSVSVETMDIGGNKAILSQNTVGEVFAETYAMLKNEPIPVDVVAITDCEIMFVSIWMVNYFFEKGQLESWEAKLLTNLLKIANQKNRILSQRNLHTSPRTIRGKVEAYLHSLMIRENSREFRISLNRQEMADYLNVDRTALSAELSRMQKDGRIRYKKNLFTIIDDGI